MVKIILSNSLIVNANMHVTSSTNFSSSGLYFRFWKWNLSLQRNYVIPDDVLEVFEPIIAHRILLSSETRMKRVSEKKVLSDIREMIRIPIL